MIYIKSHVHTINRCSHTRYSRNTLRHNAHREDDLIVRSTNYFSFKTFNTDLIETFIFFSKTCPSLGRIATAHAFVVLSKFSISSFLLNYNPYTSVLSGSLLACLVLITRLLPLATIVTVFVGDGGGDFFLRLIIIMAIIKLSTSSIEMAISIGSSGIVLVSRLVPTSNDDGSFSDCLETKSNDTRAIFVPRSDCPTPSRSSTALLCLLYRLRAWYSKLRLPMPRCEFSFDRTVYIAWMNHCLPGST